MAQRDGREWGVAGGECPPPLQLEADRLRKEVVEGECGGGFILRRKKDIKSNTCRTEVALRLKPEGCKS